MQIWGKYESKGQYMKASNKKKIIEMIKKCYNREENGERMQKCKIYNDYCLNCLKKCERMQIIIKDIMETETKNESKAKKRQAVKQAEGSST